MNTIRYGLLVISLGASASAFANKECSPGYVFNNHYQRCMTPDGACNEGWRLRADGKQCEQGQAPTVSNPLLPATDVPMGQWFRIKTVFQGPNKCLEGNQSGSPVKNGSAFMDNCQGVSGQLWKIEDAGDGFVRLKTQFQGENKCLEGNDPRSPVHKGNAFLDNCQNVTGQFWKFAPAGNGKYKLSTRFKPDLCLEGNAATSPYHEGAAFLDNCQNVSGQLFLFEKQ